MYTFKKPSNADIENFIRRQRKQPFSYAAVGATQQTPPSSYIVDHNRAHLGYGAETFVEAKAALLRWEMFRLGWVELCWPDTPIKAGSTVAVLARLWGLWSLNACRIVYAIGEDGPVQKYSFAYGTLPDHAERGEERFTIEWHRRDDSVWYDILAFSRPNQVLSRLGYPVARGLQRRFARDSMAVMQRAVNRQRQHPTISSTELPPKRIMPQNYSSSPSA